VKDAIRYTAGIFPALCFVIGIFVFSRFSLNEVEHADVVARIRDRETSRADPGDAR
jgi:Na+/melibiose symporter-like transporter